MAGSAAATAGPVVLFDLDDTLMAHREAVARAIGAYVGELGYVGDGVDAPGLWYELEERHYHSYLAGDLTFEGQRRARARDLAAAYGIELDDEAAGGWFDAYFSRYRDSWTLHDDAVPALDALERDVTGLRLGIITNGEPDFQRAKLDRLDLTRRFEHVVASGAVGVTKPDAAIFRHALDRFAADRPVSRAAYVGDRLHTDAIGAVRAGLVGVWVNRTGTAPSAEDAAAAAEAGVIEIPTLAELPAIIATRLGGGAA